MKARLKDCPHGSPGGRCYACEHIALEEKVAALRSERRLLLDAGKTLKSAVAALEAENAYERKMHDKAESKAMELEDRAEKAEAMLRDAVLGLGRVLGLNELESPFLLRDIATLRDHLQRRTGER